MMLVSTAIMVCLHFGRIQIIVAQRVLSHFCSQLSGYSNMLRNINFMREKCAFHTVEYFTIHASVVSLGRFLETRVKIIGYIFIVRAGIESISVRTSMVSYRFLCLSGSKGNVAQKAEFR